MSERDLVGLMAAILFDHVPPLLARHQDGEIQVVQGDPPMRCVADARKILAEVDRQEWADYQRDHNLGQAGP